MSHLDLVGQTITGVNHSDGPFHSEFILTMQSGDVFVFAAEGDEFYEEDVTPIHLSKARKI